MINAILLNWAKLRLRFFLSHLAVDRNVATATRLQALNAIVFLYKRVLDLPVADDLAPVRSRNPVAAGGGFVC